MKYYMKFMFFKVFINKGECTFINMLLFIYCQFIFIHNALININTYIQLEIK